MNLEEVFERLDQYVEQQMQSHGTPGLALALTDRERLLRVATYGFADLAARAPLAPETLFEIGSIGKSFTSLALLQLREAGRLDLHQPVARYLPWFEVRSAYAPITPHHLMSHTAGIPMGADADPYSLYEVWALRDATAAHPPGEHFHYSNDGYKALGLVLEELLDGQYGEIVKARILDPLGMDATAAVFTHETRPRMAVGYGRLYDDRPRRGADPLVPANWVEYGGGDGSIASTPADMAAYLRMLLNRGHGPQGRIISEDSFALMTQRVIEVPEWDAAYGYGLSIQELDGHTLVGHGGGMIGYASIILGDMDQGFGAVVLINGPGDCYEIAQYALGLLRAAGNGRELPAVPPPNDSASVERAADYAGTYICGAQALTFVAGDRQLFLDYGGRRIGLERRGDDTFFADHPDFARFPLRFGRVAGEVVEVSYGADWYAGDRYAGPTTFDFPADWAAYPGHYRSHNPWLSNFRVVLRKGALALVSSSGDEEPLTRLGDGAFRVGHEDHSPERIRFDTIVGGRALRANLSGGDYYRFFTP